MSMGNVRGGRISAGDKKKIADLKKKSKQTAVYRGGKRLNQSELDQRKADLQRQIANIQTRGGSEAYSYRPRFFGTPKKDVRTPSVTDTNINELLRANIGQPGSVRAEKSTVPTAPPRRSSVSSVNDTNINELMVRNLGQQGGFPQPITAQPGMSFQFARNPKAASSRIPSIYAQDYARQDPLRSITGSVKSNINILPDNYKKLYQGNRSQSLMDILERDTGGFPSALPRTTVEPVTDTNINDILVSNLGQQGGLYSPMTTDGRSFSRPYGTKRGISLGTVGGVGRGLFDALASSGAGYFPRQEPIFRIGFGSFGDNFTVNPFTGTTANDLLREKAAELSASFPNVTAYVGGLLDKIPFSTGDVFGQNIMIKPRGAEYDIYGNPIRQISPEEIQSTYGSQIEKAMKGKTYKFI